jgi:hypothetical protein
VFIIGTILVTLWFSVAWVHKIYSDIYRLSIQQISDSLSGVISECTKISECQLLPGDILIRRFITQRTWLIDKLAHPYFTHSAFYLGNDKIVEAVGTEEHPVDDIQIASLSKSDWEDADIEVFVIIRPHYSTQQLATIESNLEAIARDPDYIFGLPKRGYKRTTCADLIFKQLSIEKIINVHSIPWIITPDYLFSVAIENQTSFEIVGYHFND